MRGIGKLIRPVSKGVTRGLTHTYKAVDAVTQTRTYSNGRVMLSSAQRLETEFEEKKIPDAAAAGAAAEKAEEEEDMDVDLEGKGMVEGKAEKITAHAKDGAEAEKFEFKAETRQLLEIVTNSLYTDKEVFLRELISNASDALEKLRHAQVSGEASGGPPLEIRISTDPESRTITIVDSGIGMSKEDLHLTLGTIARSGSKVFLKNLQEEGKSGDLRSNLIGQFGVGFYSAFMVADSIDVYTRPAIGDGDAHVWRSDGSGNYEILPAEDVARGTSIVIHLKETCADFAKQKEVDSIIKKYSNFVNYPVFLNGNKVNTIGAIWAKQKNMVSPDEHKAFFKFVGNNWMDPLYTMHYLADAPIELKVLFYVGESHMEKGGLGRMPPGVHLYSKKVLIERNCKHLLPDWMRFVQGVVDSEDIPLSLSRESMQDSALMQRVKGVLTKKFIRFLDEQAKNDAKSYNTDFWPDFGQFIREGACSDFVHKESIAKLLRFYSTADAEGKSLTSLDEYVSRSKASQQNIYYLAAPSVEQAHKSPYMEIFKRNNLEVLVLTHPIDEFVMQAVQSFNGRTLKSAESEDLDLDTASKEAEKELQKEKKSKGLSEAKTKNLIEWIQSTLGDKVKTVKSSYRLVNTPAVITDHESASFRRMMKHVEANNEMSRMINTSHNLEINPTHFIIKNLDQVRVTDPALAKEVLEQIYDNSLISAGIMDDPSSMTPRMNSLLERVLAHSVKEVIG